MLSISELLKSLNDDCREIKIEGNEIKNQLSNFNWINHNYFTINYDELIHNYENLIAQLDEKNKYYQYIKK